MPFSLTRHIKILKEQPPYSKPLRSSRPRMPEHLRLLMEPGQPYPKNRLYKSIDDAPSFLQMKKQYDRQQEEKAKILNKMMKKKKKKKKKKKNTYRASSVSSKEMKQEKMKKSIKINRRNASSPFTHSSTEMLRPHGNQSDAESKNSSLIFSRLKVERLSKSKERAIRKNEQNSMKSGSNSLSSFLTSSQSSSNKKHSPETNWNAKQKKKVKNESQLVSIPTSNSKTSASSSVFQLNSGSKDSKADKKKLAFQSKNHSQGSKKLNFFAKFFTSKKKNKRQKFSMKSNYSLDQQKSLKIPPITTPPTFFKPKPSDFTNNTRHGQVCRTASPSSSFCLLQEHDVSENLTEACTPKKCAAYEVRIYSPTNQ